MYLYIMGNDRPTLYSGMSDDLIRRVYEHKTEKIEGFTKKYHLHKLLYFEGIEGQFEAIIREKQVKDMNRDEKLKMIEQINPKFEDLYQTLFESEAEVNIEDFQ